DDKVIPLPPDLVGPNPILAQTYLQTISVAFLGTYVAKQPQYRAYLGAAYVQLLSQPSLSIDLVRSLTPDQLTNVERGRPAGVIVPNTDTSGTGTGG
ncbi:MAG: hypothetical protein HC772_17370, partial [Leptolyngbyaceae cyanobacterium CRU_2_3]|nr:hypothetical protein [Leptolyngbyaceae cyanobacterium CRU_2_3]